MNQGACFSIPKFASQLRILVSSAWCGDHVLRWLWLRERSWPAVETFAWLPTYLLHLPRHAELEFNEMLFAASLLTHTI